MLKVANQVPCDFQQESCPNWSDAPERTIWNSSSAEKTVLLIQSKVTSLPEEISGQNPPLTKTEKSGTTEDHINVKPFLFQTKLIISMPNMIDSDIWLLK